MPRRDGVTNHIAHLIFGTEDVGLHNRLRFPAAFAVTDSSCLGGDLEATAEGPLMAAHRQADLEVRRDSPQELALRSFEALSTAGQNSRGTLPPTTRTPTKLHLAPMAP